MILIADSGSTKCDWILADNFFEYKTTTSTRGLNPLFVDDDKLVSILKQDEVLSKNVREIKQVYFFGAGVSGSMLTQRVKNVLRSVFSAAQVYVANDVEGSAIATWSGITGISCILGTGSNCVLFDGRRYREGLPSLGYILGDEGSGTWIGKQLLTDFFYKRMPTALAEEMEDTYELIRLEVIDNIYRQPEPNRYLAAFAKFAATHKTDTYVHNLIYEGFENFIQTHVLFYKESSEIPIHFTGSIAYNFEYILLECLDKNDLEAGNIIAKPGKKLLEGLKLLNN